jgi:hypothetical protein
MVPKSEVQILAKSFSVDSSTNTEIVETSADTSPPKVDLNNVSTPSPLGGVTDLLECMLGRKLSC